MDISVSIHNDIAEKMDAIASILQIGKESLINRILEQYIADYAFVPKQSGAQFLLSLAGMFDSGMSDGSENVSTIVRDFISRKYDSTD
jgi:hypothetical protein